MWPNLEQDWNYKIHHLGTMTLIFFQQAILRSVEMCGTEDLQRKMLSSVLVVGGGFRFPGATAYLQSRLSQALVNVQCEVLLFIIKSI